jgi:HAMP domain
MTQTQGPEISVMLAVADTPTARISTPRCSSLNEMRKVIEYPAAHGTRAPFIRPRILGIPEEEDMTTNHVTEATLEWTHMLEALTALKHGDFAPRLPPQPAGTPESAVVDAYYQLVLHLNRMTAELTRVVREVGLDSRLGCQAEVPDLDGRWRELSDEVNQMAALLTGQIRQLATTTTALAKGAQVAPLPQDARGEMRGVQVAVNQLVERLQPVTASTTT